MVTEPARSRPLRKRLDAGQRRETILAAALEEFQARGYDRARVSDIAARVGVTEPVIFQNFGSKAELFVTVLERVGDRMATALAEMTKNAGDAFAALTHILDPAHVAQMHAWGAPGALFAEAAALGHDQRIAAALCQATARHVEPLSALLRRGQQEGTVRDDTSPATLAWLILSLLRSHGFRHAMLADPSHIERDLYALTLDTLRPRTTS